MARDDDDIYEKPKADIYMVLMILTFVATSIATGIMFFEAKVL